MYVYMCLHWYTCMYLCVYSVYVYIVCIGVYAYRVYAYSVYV